jgi:hypothetical protein
MNRFYRWTAAVIATIACVAALTGWSADRADRAAEAAPAGDVEALDRLADGIIAEENRLWVVTVRTGDAMQRWSGDEAAEAAQWMEQTAASLQTNNATPIWNVNVQGALANSADIDRVTQHVQANGQATLVETYEEPRTFSYSYRSPLFEGTVASGDITLNLQAAAHQNTETNEWRITLGTPAVLIEY